MSGAASIERRAASLEVRAKGRRLEGYAALFDTRAVIGPFSETIRAGAFSGSLEKDVLALVDHDPHRLLARTRSKTLKIAQDARGLSFAIEVPDTTEGRDVLALAERGDLGGMSFGFTALAESWIGDDRYLDQIDLHEISVVAAFPAYEGTTISARSRSPVGGFSLALARRYLETLR